MAEVFCTSDEESMERSERLVLKYLRDLPAEWKVFHSVAWQSLRGRRQGDGEADFVLAHPEYGLIILEVKGGGIDVHEGRWTTTNKTGTYEIKDPFLQAVASKHALLRYCQNLQPQPIRPSVGHGVVFPDITVPSGIGTYGPRSLILDREDLANPLESIERIRAYHDLRSSLKSGEMSRLKRLFAPTFSIRRTLHDQVEDASKELLELTKRQIDVLRASRRNRRLLVFGNAGTGKTVLAMERARDQAAEGGRVLYVCYNKPLGDHVAGLVAGTPGITATTFHGLCGSLLRKAGVPWPSSPSEAWWKHGASEKLIEAAVLTSTTFDSILVDEGQDFEQTWIRALELLTDDPTDSPICIFADTHQTLYCQSWTMPPDWPVCHLDINCRNTLPIATHVAAVFGDRVQSLGAQGPAVSFVSGNVGRDGEALVQQAASRLLDEERLRSDQLVILSNSTKLVHSLQQNGVVGDYVMCGIGKRGVVTETIARFKGLESDAVVLVLDDSDGLTQSELYVGISRARSFLYVIASKDTCAALQSSQAMGQ